jgi:hypothetical protein
MHDRAFSSVAVTALVAILMLCFGASGFSRSARATVDDLQVGQTVAVGGKSPDARTIHANKIEIQQALREEKLKGRIQTIDSVANSLVVLGTRIFAARDAQIVDRAGSVIPFSSLQRGWMVKVKGRLQEGGGLHASEIKLSREEAPDEAEVEGRVQSIDKARGTLTVAGLVIRLTATTMIKFD